jgi:hypothetical protein
MSQFFGIVGFLLILAGLMAVLLGIFYPVGATSRGPQAAVSFFMISSEISKLA